MPEIIIPMITPFSRGEIDISVLKKFISFAHDNRFDGLFPGGSTGGVASLSMGQHKKLLQEVIEESTGLNLFAGICRNNTEETVEIGKYALDLGYHNLVGINPYYHKYSERSIENFFDILLNELDSDFFVYNNPSLTGATLSPGLVGRLKERHSNLVGMKDSGNDISVFKEYLKIPGLRVYQGKDALLAESIDAGAVGGVCSTANFALNTLQITRNSPEKSELSLKTKELVKLVGGYEVPAIHNYLFRKLILKEEKPAHYMNPPFVDLAPLPDLAPFKALSVLPP